jgi:ribosomal protein S18 acetylase RimI-like enzyme
MDVAANLPHVIRALTLADSEAYKQLRLAGLQESSHAFCQSFEDEQSLPAEYFQSCIGDEPEHVTFGAFDGAKLVGIATLKRDKRSKARHKGFIHTMYVAPEARRRGLAEAMVAAAIDRARTMPGLEQLHLWVLNPQTSAARLLYSKLGFAAQGPVVRGDLVIDGKYVDAEYMVLRL